jgi:uncharacterized protein
MAAKEFFSASKEGKHNEVQRQLRAAPELIHEKENGLSPVLVAAYHGQKGTAELLARMSVALSIFEAAATGQTPQIVRILARDPDLINAYSEDGYQALGLACFFGYLETAQYLIKAGARVNNASRNEMKVAPLHSAAAGRHTGIVKLLLKHEADPNARQQGGLTPLHEAVQNADTESIRLMLFHGAEPEAKADDGRTPLDFAPAEKKAEISKLLKEKITKRLRH